MPFFPQILYTQWREQGPPADMFDPDWKGKSLSLDVTSRLHDMQSYFAGATLSAGIEKNPGTLNRVKVGEQFDFATGKYEPVYSLTHSTYRMLFQKWGHQYEFVRKNFCTDPRANKSHQVSDIQHFARAVGYHTDTRPDRVWRSNNVGIYLTDMMLKLQRFYNISAQDEVLVRNGRLGILPYAKIFTFRNFQEFLRRGQRDMGIATNEWLPVVGLVREHRFGHGEFGSPRYRPCESVDIGGYNGFGESLVIHLVEESSIGAGLSLRAERTPDWLKKEVWTRDDHRCICASQCCGLQHEAMFASTQSSLADRLSDFSNEYREKAKKGFVNTQLSVHHILRQKLTRACGYSKTHSLSNCLTACCYCNAQIFGEKDVRDQLMMFDNFDWLRGDGAGAVQIAAELMEHHADHSDIRRYLKDQLKPWL